MERRQEIAGDRGPHHPAWSIVLTAGLLALISLSVAAAEGYLAPVVVASVAALVGVFRWHFRSSRAFCLALANLAGVYACVFLFFAESNFPQASVAALSVGFIAPLSAFAAGSLRHRHTIESVIRSGRLPYQGHLGRILSWLAPVFGIGALTFLLPQQSTPASVQDLALLGAMAAISMIVLFVSRDVAIFLLDTGLLFEEFFERAAGLVMPAFAFLTFYSLLVILFASLYSIVDHASGGVHFRVEGVRKMISFPESLYFSVMTLSTVGYGDIVPASNLARVLTALEIVCGILLLLFGFNEIFSFARRRDRTGP